MRITHLRGTALALIGGAFVFSISALPTTAAQLLNTITLVSGNGAVGSTDSVNEVSMDGGVTWNPSVIVAQGQNGYPVSTPYHTIPGTNYISNQADGSTPSNFTTHYRTFFTLPPNFQFPSLVVDIHADNKATILLNGTAIGAHQFNFPASNFQNPAETFSTVNSSLFVPGQNTLEFRIYNNTGRSAFDYQARVSYAILNPPGTNPCLNPTIVGTPGNDAIIVLSGGPHVIDAGAGDDTIATGNSNDIICAGLGNDKVASGGGNDIIFGGAGNDAIDGGAGNDFLLGEQGNDKLNGNTGFDVCFDVQGFNMFSQCP